MKKTWTVAALLGLTAAGQTGLAYYFYHRTLLRRNVSVKRTTKMAGTDWDQYKPFLKERKEWMLKQPKEDVFITSFDGLKLHATYFPNPGSSNKLVIGFHGYTSQGLSDFIGLSHYYLKNGYKMLLLDARAHGQSEGTYIGFGCPDRLDALKWIRYAVGRLGKDCSILLHGISMGGATVLMASSLKLPVQVKGIISDCAFTSAKEVFSHVLKHDYHLPAAPILWIAENKLHKEAGYGLDDCNSAREVKKARVPVLLIHGSEDTFVPCSMCEEIYENCRSPKKKLIVPKAGHAESYYKDPQAYQLALDRFIGGIIE